MIRIMTVFISVDQDDGTVSGKHLLLGSSASGRLQNDWCCLHLPLGPGRLD